MTVWRFSRWPEWGAYDLCVLDPPWSFVTRSQKNISKCPDAHYRVQSLEDIAALPVLAWTKPDAWIVLWATNPMIAHGLRVMDAWGVTYSTMMTWQKVRPSGAAAFGTGYVLRSSTEQLLIGRVGRPRVRSHRVRSGVPGLLREHSRKPTEIYDTLIDLFGPCRRADVFARENRPGYEPFGRLKFPDPSP